MGMPTGSGPLPWTPSDLIGRAWNLFKPYWLVVVSAVFVGGLVEQVPNGIQQGIIASGTFEPGDPALAGVQLVTSLVAFPIQAFIQAGMVRLSLTVARGGTPSFGEVFSGGPKFLPMLGTLFLTGIVVGFGFLACIVPGVIAYYGLMLAPYYVIDQNLGPVEAMKASWRDTQGQKMNLFVLGLLGGLVVILGLLACGVGLFAAVPVVLVANTLAYMHISGRMAGGDGYGYGQQPDVYSQAAYGAPPAGYGPPPPGGFGGGGYGPPPGY